MAYLHNPNDPYRPEQASEEPHRAAPLDTQLQADPELVEGPASGGRIAMIAIAIALVLGVVFYGLNNSSMNPTTTTATTSSTATPTTNPKSGPPDQNVADQTRPPVAPGVRDVTPYNAQPGTTTGAAPARPQQPASGPATDQKAPPPANDANKAK